MHHYLTVLKKTHSTVEIGKLHPFDLSEGALRIYVQVTWFTENILSIVSTIKRDKIKRCTGGKVQQFH